MSSSSISSSISYTDFKAQVVNDYQIACLSREASILGRKEVLTGKAKFGIFGDGKEVAQIAMSRVFQQGDFRSGYYRDQTFMFASGMATVEQFFAQLYAIPDVEEDPFSGGRQMNAHFATRSLDEQGNWKELRAMKNTSSDTSPTASQMVRALGLALASKKYRDVPALNETPFSFSGNEVVFATIGDASTSEGVFWETVNAAGVLKVPLAFFVWDDGYGISVPRSYQTTKDNISEVLSGFQLDENGNGIRIYEVKAWDYAALIQTFEEGIAFCRENHIPVFFHVKEVTQPQGHSTSGSHERYKSAERLEWEAEYDGLKKMKEWMLENGIAAEEELTEIEAEAKKKVKEIQKAAWDKHLLSIKSDKDVVISLLKALESAATNSEAVADIRKGLETALDPIRRDVMKAAKQGLYLTAGSDAPERTALKEWVDAYHALNQDRYNSHLFSQSPQAIGNIPVVPAAYSDNSPVKN